MQKNHEKTARPMSTVMAIDHQNRPPSVRRTTLVARDHPPRGACMNWTLGSISMCRYEVAGTRRGKGQAALVTLVQSWPSGTGGAGSTGPGAAGSKEVPQPQLRAAWGL